MLKPLSAMVLGTLMIFSTAASAAEDVAALPPGKAAGVHEAQLNAPMWVWIVGIGLVGLGIGLAVSSGGGNTTGTSTSTNL